MLAKMFLGLKKTSSNRLSIGSGRIVSSRNWFPGTDKFGFLVNPLTGGDEFVV